MIDMEQAAATAIEKFRSLYISTGLDFRDPMLEEIQLSDDKKSWHVTIGFNVTEFEPPSALDLMLAKASEYGQIAEKKAKTRRKYKLFTIDGDEGTLMSMTMKNP